MKSKKEREHDQQVSELEETLLVTGEAHECVTFMDYTRNGEVGEVDLIAIKYGDPPSHVFYEVKTNPKLHHKAKSQYEKYLRAFNVSRDEIPGFMYCNGDRRKL